MARRCARKWFEYHCYEGEDSADAELWHHTHQPVTVLHQVDNPDQIMWRVLFMDGFQHEAFDDELVRSPAQFQRPSYRAS